MHRARPIARTTTLLFLLPLAASCVAQQQYDEAVAESKYYQRLYQDLEPFAGKLEAENERLRERLRVYEEERPVEAVYTEGIDERLEKLQRIASGLGGEPGDVTVVAVEGGYGYRVSDAVLFDSGSAQIRPDGRAILENLARDIATRPYERIWVRGHTDSDPVTKPETLQRFPHGNLQLSAARAIEVASLLVGAEGIDRSKVVVAGFGPSEPVAPNASPEGKQRNRRVEIFVIEDEAAAGRAERAEPSEAARK